MKLHIPYHAYHAEKTTIRIRNEALEVKAYQIIVWVSIAFHNTMEWDSRLPKIPTILDTGNTHNFAIAEEQLKKWAGIHAESLPTLKAMREKGQRVPLRSGVLWLHTDREPFELAVEEGIGVYEEGGPRLPILGLRALTRNKLQTVIDGESMQGHFYRAMAKQYGQRREGGTFRHRHGNAPGDRPHQARLAAAVQAGWWIANGNLSPPPRISYLKSDWATGNRLMEIIGETACEE